MNLEVNSLAYCLILDDMLQNFSFEMGIDMDNNETPFGKYWKAVNQKGHAKNAQITQLTKIMNELNSVDDQSKQNLYNFMNLIEMDDGTPYYIKSFILEFGRNKSSWKLSTEEGVVAVKKAFNSSMDSSYMWGYVENQEIIKFWKHMDPNAPKVKIEQKKDPSEILNDISKKEPEPKPESPKKELEPEPKPESPKKEPEPVQKIEYPQFDMRSNPSQFPRKPSKTIKEREMMDSNAPSYQGRLIFVLI